jgi:hypothetical protein
MTDRFTTATAELAERNPFISDSSMKVFGHPTIGQADSGTGSRRGHDDTNSWQARDDNTRGAECIYNCDPMPFGD